MTDDYRPVELRPCEAVNNVGWRCPGEEAEAPSWRYCGPCRGRRAIAGRGLPRQAAGKELQPFGARDTGQVGQLTLR